MLDDESTTNALESAMYWKGETRIKEAEGRLGCVVAANGAIFACRRALIPPLANDTANDFQIPLDVLAKGARSTFASDAIAREPVTANMKEEFARKRRIIIRGLTCICRAIAHLPLMIALHLVMRKVARWACPPLMLTCVIIACMALCIASEWRLLAILCAVLVTVLALAVAGRIGHGGKPTALVNYGVMLTCATTSALVAFLTGTRVESWVSPTSDRLPKE